MISSLAIIKTKHIGTGSWIHEHAIVRKNVVVGKNVVIHPFVVIEEGVVIGDGTEIFPGAYIGKSPKGAGATSRPISFDKKVCIGNNCSIGPNSIIYYDVQIGNNTLLGDGASIRENCMVGSFCIVGRYVTINYNTIIGDAVKIMDHSWLAGNMQIDDHVFISGGVLSTNDNDLGKNGYNAERVIGPKIHAGAQIGVGAILLPNLEIGNNAIVAAGAVVTKNVAPNTVVMGIPAQAEQHKPKNTNVTAVE
ncbi:MAG: transferase [Chloroflexi bacterium]|jgi:acetyltransferase-like isoleucine patch superfamily enzyme|nr:transferase [Chloroflexota bacterium]